MSGTISLLISMSSLLIAGLALGWNIYRDVVMKGRVRIRFGWRVIIDGQQKTPDMIVLSGVNHGPGKVVLQMIITKNTSLVRRLRCTVQHGFVKLVEQPSEFSDRLPKELDIGDELNLMFPSSAGFASVDFTHIGLRDNFNRIHWARKKEVQAFRKKRKDISG